MPSHWTQPAPHPVWDGYLDWARLLQRRRHDLLPDPKPAASWWQPIFVQLKPVGEPPTIEAARAALSALVNDPSRPIAMDPQEYGFLQDRLAHPASFGDMPDGYALYRQEGTEDGYEAALWTLLDVGATVNFTAGDTPAVSDEMIPDAPAGKTGAPIVAIVDDGIGFLNARFRVRDGDTDRSRFRALWLQAVETSEPPVGDAPRRVSLGRVLSRHDIDNWLARGAQLDEWAVYSTLNAALSRADERRSTDFALSHGTHVLDLAAGADPDDAADPARDWPLLGVQLPAAAVEDTSGTKFENYMVQGVRWILRQARQVDPDAPVIINLSMGILAGPKDGTRFTEYQIAREAALWEAHTGQPVRIVWAFGNAYRGNLVARFDYAAQDAREDSERDLLWRIQPDDETASFVEIHSDPATPSTDLRIAVTTPDGLGSGFVAMAPGEVRDLLRNEEVVARLYHVPERALEGETIRRAHHVIAVAQTGNKLAGEPLAPAGGWTVGVSYTGAAKAEVHLQVQRDESLSGYQPGARQSYFDAKEAYCWDPEVQDNTGLGPECPITRAGTLSALATATGTQILTAGAATRNRGADRFDPSLYTAAGASWARPGPTAATVADDGRLFWGVLAAGTYGNSVRVLNGTSVAAGRMSRALALSADLISPGAAPAFDVPQVPVHEAQHARLGAAVLNVPGGARMRNGA